MSADVSAGAGMVPTLAGWPAAGPHQVALKAFYADLANEIDRGLSASVNSAGQYKKAAKGVLATLSRMPALDADARTLAGTAGMEMPVVVIPDTLLVPWP
jgi:CTP:molybdopterin cytidylyltransferase MocA